MVRGPWSVVRGPWLSRGAGVTRRIGLDCIRDAALAETGGQGADWLLLAHRVRRTTPQEHLVFLPVRSLPSVASVFHTCWDWVGIIAWESVAKPRSTAEHGGARRRTAKSLFILHHHRQQRRSAPVRSAPPFSATPCLSVRRSRSRATAWRESLSLHSESNGAAEFADYRIGELTGTPPPQSLLSLFDLARGARCATQTRFTPRSPVSARSASPSESNPIRRAAVPRDGPNGRTTDHGTKNPLRLHRTGQSSHQVIQKL